MADLENRVSNLETKMDMFIDEMRDFKNEMRQQNEMRAAEIARVDAKFEAKMEKLREDREKDNAKHEADIKAINERIDAKVAKIEEKVDSISREIRGMAIATILGVGAIVWAIVSALT